jgi:hypothetical protein
MRKGVLGFAEARDSEKADHGAIISFFIYFSSSFHLMSLGAEYISLVTDAPGAVTACVATAQDCSLFPGLLLYRYRRKEEVARYEA